MKKKINSILLLILLSIGMPNCKDEERPSIYIDQATLDYCDFKIGSWWAYEEEQSSIIDTISIFNYTFCVNLF